MYKNREDWLSKNPLRLWLEETGTTVTDAASRIRRNPTTMHHWLRGSIAPLDSYDRLQKLTGNKNLDIEWSNWLIDQPGLIT